jgi:hypothetical protein
LGEGGDRTSEGGCHEGLIPRKDVHRDKTGFVEVYREPGGCGEIIENKLEMRRGPSVRLADDKRVVRILEDGAGGGGREGVRQLAQGKRVADQALKNICHNDQALKIHVLIASNQQLVEAMSFH